MLERSSSNQKGGQPDFLFESSDIRHEAEAEILRISQIKGRARDQDQLTEMLKEIVAHGRYKPQSTAVIFDDKQKIEGISEINLDKSFLTLRKPFDAYWTGRYKTDAIRFGLLTQLIKEEKAVTNHRLSYEDRVWEWAQRYFDGCDTDNEEVPLPDNQSTHDVLAAFKDDCDLVPLLPLSDVDKAEVVRVLRIFFLENVYPISLENRDPASRDAMRRAINMIASSRRENREAVQHSPIAIAIEMQRYRMHVTLGLDHESEEIKRREESRNIDIGYQQDLERRKRDFEIESEFIGSLSLPEYEAEDWPRSLIHQASGPYFKIDPSAREAAHNDIRELIENLPAGHDSYYGDPWMVITHLIHSYWLGQYFPDSLRRMVLKNELDNLPKNESAISPTGRPTHQFLLREMFVRGSSLSGAAAFAKQDPILLGRSYQRDMQLIHALTLGPITKRKTAYLYNERLLAASMPISPDCEQDSDRTDLEADLHGYVERATKDKFFSSITIVDMFYEHWHRISQRGKK